MKKIKSAQKTKTTPDTEGEKVPLCREYPLLPMKAKIKSFEDIKFAQCVRENPNGIYAIGSEGDGHGN
jgi:hypothetical protein